MGAEEPNAPHSREFPDEPNAAPRVGAVDALIRRARREIAETGQVSAATADALQSSVSTLSYAELHALIVGQRSPGDSGSPDN